MYKLKEVQKTETPEKEEKTHVLFKVEKGVNLPTVVFFSGIHGNEKAGVVALQHIQKTVESLHLKGNVYGVLGNLKALESNQRYIDEDLNRLWTEERLNQILSKTNVNVEEKQAQALFVLLHQIINKHNGPLYFIDLHTTSSKTLPFVTINDAMINREFSKQFPVPIVLGIEEYLEGPLLSYINTLGFVSIGFESGHHMGIASVQNNIAFINLALVYTGVLEENQVDVMTFRETLKIASEHIHNFFEIIHLQKISKTDDFKMNDGFKSFQPIEKGTLVARLNTTEILSEHEGYMFMPLYQKKGNEGYFVIRYVPRFILRASKHLRRFKADTILTLLPGVSWSNKSKGVLRVNLKIAKYFTKPIFHVLGYRSRQVSPTHLFLYNRERVAKTKLYK
ncbi:MAG: succinylglutamate desuccinylase/aspartoacylase family protein [Jejuia sp.]